MSQPDGFATPFDVLLSDAAEWQSHADVMEAAALQAASFGLTGFHFGYIADGSGVTAKYTAVQELAIRLLSEGAVAMREFAEALVRTADDYQNTDQRSGGRIVNAGSTLRAGE